MSLRRAALAQHRRSPFAFRSFSSMPARRAADKTPPPPSNMPPNAQKAGKTQIPGKDSQSSASVQEGKTGDDHPAKQPDPQAEVGRSTGFGNVKGGVEGGKEGMHHRSDRNADGK
ncbi:hypothetical protein MBLNU13_g10918t2 [Cladosporium sp. NU13]